VKHARWIRYACVAVAAAACVAACVSQSAATADRNQTFSAVAAPSPPALDGTVDDPEWSKALQATDFEDFTTHRPAPLATTAYLLYDSRNLYVAFRCAQTGAPITATQSTNNVGMGIDDDVAISIDTSGVGAEVYDFYVTPRGVRYQDSSESTRYNPPWQAAAKIVPGGWTAELVIPLQDLRASSSSNSWLFNFQRHVAAQQEYYSWAYDSQMSGTGNAQFWPKLVDLHVPRLATRPKPRADVYGLASAGPDRNVFQQGFGSFVQQPAPVAGVDFTYPFTDTLAAVGTVAPDFSNVEIDQQTIAPQEFQRFLTEYRPFFAQGANDVSPNVFNYNDSDTLFYSPSIGKFDDGLKVEGTIDRTTIGALDVKGDGFDDTAFGYTESTANQFTNWFADGVLARHSDGVDDTLQAGFIGLNPLTQIGAAFKMAQETGTFVPDDSLARSSLLLVGDNRPAFTAFTGYYDIGPYFNPIDGFTQINDIAGPLGLVKVAGAGSATDIIKSWNAVALEDRYVDHSGAVHESDGVVNLDVNFKDLFSLTPFVADGTLRSYAQCYPQYIGGQTLPYDQAGMQVGYRDETPEPLDVSYSAGPFGLPTPDGSGETCGSPGTNTPAYLQQYSSTTSRPIGPKLTLGLEFDGTDEHFQNFSDDSQWLRRISLDRSLGKDSDISIGYRDISGEGGFTVPGKNLSVGFHARLSNEDEIYANFGSPEATSTLYRYIVKVILHFGGAAGA
jgi:hypothetical protein